MRILQLVDSLQPGGTERVAVTLANGLSNAGMFSMLCATRKEGSLKTTISNAVQYRFLNKKATFDVRALLALRKLVVKQKIDVIHAHSTSFLYATLVKITVPKLKIVWHEHHGNRVNTKKIENKALVFCSWFFNAIIAVNEDLVRWCQEHLKTKKISYIPNFVDDSKFKNQSLVQTNTIICLANLRHPKNHLNLIEAFKIVHARYKNWQLQLMGADYGDAYAQQLKQKIGDYNLQQQVTFIESATAVEAVLLASKIGVLSSNMEGLPMSLLEYGAANLAVVTTNVGQCKEVLGDDGLVVPVKNPEAFSNAIISYIEDEKLREKNAKNFNIKIANKYSVNAVLPNLIALYKSL